MGSSGFYYCGLVSRSKGDDVTGLNSPVPLQSVTIRADVRGIAVGIMAELVYVNPHKNKQIIECEFVMPRLSDDAAVYRLEAKINGRRFRAGCQDKEDAYKIYNNKGQNETRGVIRLFLGCLPPRKTVSITLGFVQLLERDANGHLSFVLPTVLNPRYVHSSQTTFLLADPEKMRQHLRLSVPSVSLSSMPYAMNFEATICLGFGSNFEVAEISEVHALNSSDLIEVAIGGDNSRTASVKLANNFSADHEFGLRIVPVNPWQAMIYVEPGLDNNNGGNANWLGNDIAVAWFEPRQQNAEHALFSDDGAQYWLVIDRSASMRGEKIIAARNALLTFLRNLPPRCFFNIIGFGTTFECVFGDRCVPSCNEYVARAINYANKIEADFGGAEILKPLELILQKGSTLKRTDRRFVFLLTGGKIDGEEKVIHLVKMNAEKAVFFVTGIGECTDDCAVLINGLARVSNGVAQFVRNSNDLETKILGQLRATTQSCAVDTKVTWQISPPGKVVALAPEHVRPIIFQGHPLLQFAAIKRPENNENPVIQGSALITATLGDGKFAQKLDFKLLMKTKVSSSSAPGPLIMPLHRLAAKMRIQSLEDELLKVQMGDHKGDEARKAAFIGEIVNLSMSTGVLTRKMTVAKR